ncbi:MAG TPA: formate dehydrogenase subunit gamma [Gammaproteobacteria bacterium]|nr:formate dehydrogenase subunit gamma [Gammaproteobacteria bacterium]
MVDRTQPGFRGRGRRKLRRAMLLTALVLGLSMILPLTGLLLTDAPVGQAVAQQAQPQDEVLQQQRADKVREEEQRRDFWRQARSGTAGYSAVTGQETGVLIQSGGDVWRSVREGPLLRWGGIGLVVVLAAIILFHLLAGPVKLEHRTGRTITRWSLFERVMHWYTAILFIILAITGLSLTFGRAVLIPVTGKEAFAAWANIAKPVHDWLAVPFIIGLVVMMVPWIKESLPRAHDLTWLRMGGGYLDKSKHPPAGFVNAGEKIWFWLLFFGSIVLISSGFWLLFPNFGFERGEMQLANILHAASGIALIAFSLGHIYLGTLGNQGTLEGMVHGEVDEAWAKAHHGLWYDEVKKQGTRPATASPPHGAGHAAT